MVKEGTIIDDAKRGRHKRTKEKAWETGIGRDSNRVHNLPSKCADDLHFT